MGLYWYPLYAIVEFKREVYRLVLNELKDNFCTEMNKMIEALILFAILGIFAGLIAGMFGVGGGIITVPFFVAFFIQFGFEEEIIIHMAVGTSLGCIAFIGISSAYAHSKKNAISYNFLKPLASGIVIGAFLGALFAVQLNGNLLEKQL